MPQSPAAVMTRPAVPIMLENNAMQSPAQVTRALRRSTVGLDLGKNILLDAARDLSGKKLAELDNVKIAEDDHCSNYWIAATENNSECVPTLAALTNALNGFIKNMEQSHATQLLMLSEHAQIILERNALGAIMFSDANLAIETVVKSEYSAIDEKLTCDVIQSLHGKAKFEALMQRIDRNAAADVLTKNMESMSFHGGQNGVESSAISTLAVFATPRTSEVSEALTTPRPLTAAGELKPEPLAAEIVGPALKARPALALVPVGSVFSEDVLQEAITNPNDSHRSDSIGSWSSLSEHDDAKSQRTVSDEPIPEMGTESCLDFSDLRPDPCDGMGANIFSQQTDDTATSSVHADARSERELQEAKELEAIVFSVKENGEVDPDWETTNIIDGIIENLTGTAKNIEDRSLYTNLKTDKIRFAESTKSNQEKLEVAYEKLGALAEPLTCDTTSVSQYSAAVDGLTEEIKERELQLQMAAEALAQEKKCSAKLIAWFEKNSTAKRVSTQSSSRLKMLKAYNDQRALFSEVADRQDYIQASLLPHNNNSKQEAEASQGANNEALAPVETTKIVSAIDVPKEAKKIATTRSHKVVISSTNAAANKKMAEAVEKYKKFKSYAIPAEAELEMNATEAELEQEVLKNMLPIISDNVERIFEPEGERSTQAIHRSSFRRTAIAGANRTLGAPVSVLTRQQLRDAEVGADL